MKITHGLFDVGTNSLLAIAGNPGVIVFLSETIPYSYHWFEISPRPLPFDVNKPAEFPNWTWSNDASKTFSPAPPEIQSDDIRARSRLAVAKGSVIGRMMSSISYMRTPLTTGVFLQETAYLAKRLEAERIKANDYVAEPLHEFPFLVQYADFAGLSIREAVDEILFQASLDNQLLAKTEVLRVRYFRAVKAAETPEAARQIHQDFRRDCYLQGLI